jgi:hypothetical protein
VGGGSERIALGVGEDLDRFHCEHLAGVIVGVAVTEAAVAHCQLVGGQLLAVPASHARTELKSSDTGEVASARRTMPACAAVLRQHCFSCAW